MYSYSRVDLQDICSIEYCLLVPELLMARESQLLVVRLSVNVCSIGYHLSKSHKGLGRI